MKHSNKIELPDSILYYNNDLSYFDGTLAVFNVDHESSDDLAYRITYEWAEGKTANGTKRNTKFVKGKSLHQIFGQTLFDKYKQYFEEALNGENVEFVIRYINKIYLIKLSPDNSSIPINRIFLIALDLTKYSNKLLNQSKSDYLSEALNDKLPVGIYRVTIDGQIIYANNALAKILGLNNKHELMNVNISQFWLTLDNRNMQQDRIVQQNNFLSIEIKLITQNNEIIWVNDTFRPVYSQNGNVEYFDGIIEDITEAKLKNDRLKQSEQKYRKLLESLQEGILVFDSEYKITFVNIHTAEMLGYSTDDFVGKSIFTFLSRKSVNTLNNKIYSLLKGNTENIELELIHNNKSIIFAIFEISVLFDESGNYSGAICGIMDITYRKQYEHDLKKRLGIESFISKTSKKFISITGDRLNDEIQETLDYIAQILQANHTALFIMQDNIPKINQIYGTISNMQFRNIKISDWALKCHGFNRLTDYLKPDSKDNSIFTFNINNLPLDIGLERIILKHLQIVSGIIVLITHDSALLGFIFIGTESQNIILNEHDLLLLNLTSDLYANLIIRIHLEHERQIAANAKIEAERQKVETEMKHILEKSANAASIGVVAGSVTHEINQPLNAIKIGAQSIISWTENNSKAIPEPVISMLNGINDSVGRIEDIVKMMRSIWLNTDKQNTETVDINQSIQQSLAYVKSMLQKYNIDIILDLSDASMNIIATKIQTELILVNLLTNAVQAINKSNHTEKTIYISTFTKDSCICIKIEDTGTGLPDINYDLLFDPFFSSKKNEGGTGLGLAVIKYFLKQFSAEIYPSNNSHGGATFTLKFPAIKSDVQNNN